MKQLKAKIRTIKMRKEEDKDSFCYTVSNYFTEDKECRLGANRSKNNVPLDLIEDILQENEEFKEKPRAFCIKMKNIKSREGGIIFTPGRKIRYCVFNYKRIRLGDVEEEPLQMQSSIGY